MDRIRDILRDERVIATEINKVADDGNSEIYLIKTEGIEKIVKVYSENDICRYRLRNEARGIRIGNCASLRTPEIYHISSKNNMIVMEYIQGRKLEVLQDWHIESLARGMWEIRRKKEMRDVGYAKGACLTLKRHYEDTSERILEWKRLISRQGECYPRQLKQWINELDSYMLERYDTLISSVDARRLVERNRSLEVFSQSDVGRHNLLEKGRLLYTIDMEYSGLDDITKNIVDWYLQPDYAMDLREVYKYTSYLEDYGIWTSDIAERIELVGDIHRIKWSLIILNKYRKSRGKELIEKSINYFHRTSNKIRELTQVL